MRHYELVCIVHPDLDETALNNATEKVKGWVLDAGGHVDKVETWGRKRLAYTIRKQNEGQYVLFNISLDPATTPTLEHNLQFMEPVIRFMVTLVN
jgi:small subunit ribosomal protein S6